MAEARKKVRQALNKRRKATIDRGDTIWRNNHEFLARTEFPALERCIKSERFEWAVIFITLLNALLMGIAVEWMAWYQEKWPWEDAVNKLFTLIFVTELALRLLVDRGTFFTNAATRAWNMFDLVVVVCMLLEQIMLMANALDSNLLSQLSAWRIARALRGVRVLQVLRTVRMFREMRMMIHSIMSCFLSLMWVVVLLGLLFFVFSVILTQGVLHYLLNEGFNVDIPLHGSLQSKFGTLEGTTLSLYETMAGGINWGELVDLLAPLPRENLLFFLMFTIFALFAIVNIIMGVFVENAIEAGRDDTQAIIEESMNKKQALLEKIHNVFVEMDTDKTGTVTHDEFEDALHDQSVLAYFQVLGLDIDEAKTLFGLLDHDQNGSIDVEEFVSGCMRLKGDAKSLDIGKLQLEMEWVISCLEHVSMITRKLDVFLEASMARQQSG